METTASSERTAFHRPVSGVQTSIKKSHTKPLPDKSDAPTSAAEMHKKQTLEPVVHVPHDDDEEIAFHQPVTFRPHWIFSSYWNFEFSFKLIIEKQSPRILFRVIILILLLLAFWYEAVKERSRRGLSFESWECGSLIDTVFATMIILIHAV